MNQASPTTVSDLCVSKEALFAKLGYEPHQGQARVHASTAPRRVVACGARWGKSLAASMEVVAALLEPRQESRGWIVAPTLDLSQRIFRHVEHVLRDRLKHRILAIETREHRIVVRNLGGGASEVKAKSADNPTSLLGEALDWLVVDEAARLRDDIWPGFLSQRLLDREGWALLISTPNGTNGFYALFDRGRGGEDASFESFTGPTTENPHVSAALIEAERERLSRDEFAQEYGAKFLGAGILPCARCGGPSREWLSTYVVREPEDEPVTCETCGRLARPDGRTLVGLQPDGRLLVSCTRLEPRPKVPSPEAA